MYACMPVKDPEYSKVKGYKKTILLEILTKCLDQNHAQDLIQTKWIKYIKESKINVDENSKFKLVVTDLKRRLIYENNKLVGTKSIHVTMKTPVKPSIK